MLVVGVLRSLQGPYTVLNKNKLGLFKNKYRMAQYTTN